MKPNKETYRILVIDDHPIVAEGIIALASQLEGVTCKGATCAKDVEQLTLKERFDLCIIDLELPDMNGFQLISHLHSQIPECGILIYTMHEEPWIIAKLSTLNINGAVSKNASTSELRDAISTLKNGTRYFSNVFSELDKEKQNTLPHALPELSRREKEVLAYLSQGLSTSFSRLDNSGSACGRVFCFSLSSSLKTLLNLSTRGRAYSENTCHSPGQLQASSFSSFSV